MVIVTYQVKQAMNHHAIQFLVEVDAIELGIILHAVYTDEQISTEDILLAVIESDDVGKVIVLEIFHINVEDIVIRTENDVNVTYLFNLAFGDKFEPSDRKSVV